MVPSVGSNMHLKLKENSCGPVRIIGTNYSIRVHFFLDKCGLRQSYSSSIWPQDVSSTTKEMLNFINKMERTFLLYLKSILSDSVPSLCNVLFLYDPIQPKASVGLALKRPCLAITKTPELHVNPQKSFLNDLHVSSLSILH